MLFRNNKTSLPLMYLSLYKYQTSIFYRKRGWIIQMNSVGLRIGPGKSTPFQCLVLSFDVWCVVIRVLDSGSGHFSRGFDGTRWCSVRIGQNQESINPQGRKHNILYFTAAATILSVIQSFIPSFPFIPFHNDDSSSCTRRR
jgi:hypothetical protein